MALGRGKGWSTIPKRSAPVPNRRARPIPAAWSAAFYDCSVQQRACLGVLKTSFFMELQMQKTLNLIRDFAREEDGVTAIEYGLLAALVAVGIIVGAGFLGNNLNNLFNNLGTRMGTAATTAS